MPVSLEVQRTIKRAEIWALYMALTKLCGTDEIFSDNTGVMQALNKGEVTCISASRKDADLWGSGLAENWRVFVHEGIDLHVIWTEAQSTLEDKAKMSPENRQVAWGSETADELAKTGAVKDCAEMVAEHALNTRQVYAAIRHAATFLDEVGELVRVEEVGGEDKKQAQVAIWP